MTRTTLRPQAPHASGLAVHPWADVVLAEPEHDAGPLAPAGQLWSTLADQAIWTQVLAGRRPDILAPESAAAMVALATVAEVAGDPLGWTIGHGLGPQIMLDPIGSRAGGVPRRLVGHTGSMPGFLATVWVGADDDVAGIAFANVTSGPAVPRLVADLVDIVAAAEPVVRAPWIPASDPDPALIGLTGPWYWGPTAFALRLGVGRDLVLTPLGAAGRRSRFVPAGGTDGECWTGLDGYYRGETLRVMRDGRGEVTHLDLGSFVLTRAPYAPADVIPGGVDPEGWHPTS